MPIAAQKLFMPLYRASHWPDGSAYQHGQRRWMLQRVLGCVPVQGVRTVLEVGCGDGWVCNEMGKRFGQVVGFDINPHRIGKAALPNVHLVAGSADHPPIADGSVDLILSLAVLEHLPDRVGTLQQLTKLLSPEGVMVHIVPMSMMKILQWVGHGPDLLRKQVRGATRFLAGQRKGHKGKYYGGMETNNPQRKSRRRWHQKVLPRVHGEYDSNLQEIIENSDGKWRSLFGQAGLGVTRVVPLGVFSPYFFGLSASLKRLPTPACVATVNGYIMHKLDKGTTS